MEPDTEVFLAGSKRRGTFVDKKQDEVEEEPSRPHFPKKNSFDIVFDHPSVSQGYSGTDYNQTINDQIKNRKNSYPPQIDEFA